MNGAVAMVKAAVTEDLGQADTHRKQWIQVTEGGLASAAKQFMEKSAVVWSTPQSSSDPLKDERPSWRV